MELHDIGTCVTDGGYPDQPATDILGGPRSPCEFDTPTLRGIFATAPYFHDGSSLTLDDAVARIPAAADLTDDERADLVAFLKDALDEGFSHETLGGNLGCDVPRCFRMQLRAEPRADRFRFGQRDA